MSNTVSKFPSQLVLGYRKYWNTKVHLKCNLVRAVAHNLYPVLAGVKLTWQSNAPSNGHLKFPLCPMTYLISSPAHAMKLGCVTPVHLALGWPPSWVKVLLRLTCLVGIYRVHSHPGVCHKPSSLRSCVQRAHGPHAPLWYCRDAINTCAHTHTVNHYAYASIFTIIGVAHELESRASATAWQNI